MRCIEQWLYKNTYTGDKSLSEQLQQQTYARILLSIASMSYVVLHAPYYSEFMLPALLCFSIYLIANAFSLLRLRQRPFGVTGMLFNPIQDAGIVSFAMLLDGGHSSSIYFMLLVIIIGNGLRFGNAMLLFSQALCIAGTLLVAALGYELLQILVDGTLLSWQLFTLIAVPFYVYLIGKKLEKAMQEKHVVEQSSFDLIDKGAVPIFTFELDEQGQPAVQYANTAVAELYRIPQEQLTGCGVGAFTLPEDTEELSHYCRSMLNEQNGNHHESSLYIRGMDNSGEIIKLMVRAIRMRWHNRWIGVCFLVDITERETLQEQLETVHRHSYMSTMVAGIVHDFRNLLTNMIGYAEVLQMSVNDKSQLKMIDEMIAAGERGSEMITHLLKLSRNVKLSSSDQWIAGTAIKEPIENIIGLARLQLPAKIKILYEIREPLDDASISLIEIEQILLNLINNAMQAINGPGEIRILIRGDQAHPLAEGGRSALSIEVSDSGCGIAREDLENIFKPFWSSRAATGGSGLGLTMVQRIVKLHNGIIDAASEPGHGTTIHIHLPPWLKARTSTMAGSARAQPAPSEAEMAPNLASMNLIVVDDGEDVLRTHKALLERMGHRVTTFSDPRQALQALEGQPEAYHMLITDFRMPGMNGLELVRAARSGGYARPILMITAYGEDEHLKEVLTHQVAIINKPVSFHRFRSGLAEAVALVREHGHED